MKKLILILAAIVASNVFASDIEINGIWYDFNNVDYTASVTFKGAKYSSYTNEYQGNVVIPATVDYNNATYTVTSIVNSAFTNCSKLTSVIIPGTVTSIEQGAFTNCTGLKKVIIGDPAATPSLPVSLAENAFYLCSELDSVLFHSPLASIGEGCFKKCAKLTGVILPATITSIAKQAFYGCGSLTEITIPHSVTELGSGAFNACSKLKEVTINANAIVSKDYQWEEYEYMQAIFGTQVETYIIGDSVKSIGNYAFYGFYDSPLSTVVISNSVVSIGEGAFEDNPNLANITLPNSVIDVDYYAFTGCAAITSPIYNSTCFAYMPAAYAGALVVSDGIQKIAPTAFYKCTELTQITLPQSLKTIGGQAFAFCSAIEGINIPDSVTTIAAEAFRNCAALDSVVIGKSVTSIGDYCFYESGTLYGYMSKIICYAPNPPAIGQNFLYGVYLSGIYVPRKSLNLYKSQWGFYFTYPIEKVVEVDGMWYQLDEVNNTAMLTYQGNLPDEFNDEYTGDICIPDSIIFADSTFAVTSIDDSAFYGCSGVQSLTFLGNACQDAIGDDAFSGVGSETPVDLVLPDNWTGSTPVDNKTPWYGGYFNYTSTALPTLFGDGVKGNKFFRNGQVIIRKGNKSFSILGREMK